MSELFHDSESPSTVFRRVFLALQRRGYRPFVVSVSQLERYSDDEDFDIYAAGHWRSVGRIVYECTKDSPWIFVNYRKSRAICVGYHLISKDGYFEMDVFRYACHYDIAYLFLDSRFTTQNADGMATLSPEGEFLHMFIKGVCRGKRMPCKYYDRLYEIIDRVNFDSPVLKLFVDRIGMDNLNFLISRINSRKTLSWQFLGKLTVRLAGFRNKRGLLVLWQILKDKFFLYFDRLTMPTGIHVRIVVPDGTSWRDMSEKSLQRLSALFSRIRILEKPDRKGRRTIYSHSESDIYYNQTKEFFLYKVRFLPMALIQICEALIVVLPAKIRHAIVLEEGPPWQVGSPPGDAGRAGTWPTNALRFLRPKPDVTVIFRPAVPKSPGAATEVGTDETALHGGMDVGATALERNVIYVDESQSPEKMGEQVIERVVEYLHHRTLRRLGISDV